MAGERPMLDFFSVTGGIFDISIELTPPSLRATSPIFCCAKHRGGGLIPFYRIIYRMRRIVFVLLPCRVQWHCGELCKQYREETEETVVPEERV